MVGVRGKRTFSFSTQVEKNVNTFLLFRFTEPPTFVCYASKSENRKHRAVTRIARQTVSQQTKKIEFNQEVGVLGFVARVCVASRDDGLTLRLAQARNHIILRPGDLLRVAGVKQG